MVNTMIILSNGGKEAYAILAVRSTAVAVRQAVDEALRLGYHNIKRTNFKESDRATYIDRFNDLCALDNVKGWRFLTISK